MFHEVMEFQVSGNDCQMNASELWYDYRNSEREHQNEYVTITHKYWDFALPERVVRKVLAGTHYLRHEVYTDTRDWSKVEKVRLIPNRCTWVNLDQIELIAERQS